MLLEVFLAWILAAPQAAHTSFCSCVQFNQSGAFQSPDFPESMTPFPCLMYHFVAPPRHIVQLTFHFFSMGQRSDRRCHRSKLAFFEQSPEGEVDPFEDTPDEQFCGRDVHSGQQFHSLTEHFIFVVHSEVEVKGFSGEYKFIPRASLTVDAIQTAECAFRIEQIEGKVYSPRYPYYPSSHSNCTYLFPERKGLSLTVSSSFFTLSRQGSVEVYELKPNKVLLQRKDDSSDALYFTSPHTVLVQFTAGPSNVRNTGFSLDYNYGKDDMMDEMPTYSPSSFADCTLHIASRQGPNGTISSTQLPSRNANLPSKCLIVFEGEANEKVSVRFTYFNLYAPDHVNITKRCNEFDHVAAAVRVGTRFSRIDAWCGRDRPPPLMSSTNILQLEYNTKSSRAVRDSAPQETGFKLEYSFHTDWNMQKMEADNDPSGCRFVFNSSRRSSGKLWSVNYPGLYPRNLRCEYIFHGNENEIVHIHFEYFDVEGFNQCDQQSQSDFVLFSNYQSPDRNNRKVCGKNPPRIATISESNYYRMVFWTNEIFDATGFFAHYQFLTQQKPQISKVKFTPSAAVRPSNLFLCLLILSFYYF